MILGHERQIDYLNKVLARGRMSHAYLFYGPDGVGKFTLATLLAKALRCEKKPKSLADVCNECRDCKWIDEYRHPSVIILSPTSTLVSKKDKRKDIPIEDIRELKRIFSLAPEGDAWRIAIIDDAEKLSRDAADAMLKILEEPGEQTLMILVSSAPDFLPSTIVSRAQPIRFSLLPNVTFVQFLKECVKSPSRAEEILALAAGRPGIVLRSLAEENYFAREWKLAEEVSGLFVRGDVPSVFRFVEKVAGEEHGRRSALYHLTSCLRAGLLAHTDEKNVGSHLEKLKRVNRIAYLLDTTNVNPRLALDAMFLELVK